MQFAFKNLDVWEKAVGFAVNVINAVEGVSTGRKHYRLLEQIEASSTSVAMNIAEGKGRFSKKICPLFIHIAWIIIRNDDPVGNISSEKMDNR